MAWVTSGAVMLKRFRQSLAFRLGVLYSGLFALGAAVVFALLYWLLADGLETRERALVERYVEEYAGTYERGGPGALRGQLVSEQSGVESGALLVRVLDPAGETLFARVPSDWVETQAQGLLVPDGWGGWTPQMMHTVRVPRDADKDFTVASRRLRDGLLLQVARSTDNRATLLAPLRRTFLWVGGGALLGAAVAGLGLAWRATRPLRAVADTARRIIATGDLAARVPAPAGGGELAELVRQFNTVLTQNAALIGAMRETLDNLAHDLRTPLARLRGTADLALQHQGDPVEAREALADCMEESERILRLLEAMMDVSAAETGTLPLRSASLDLAALAGEAAELYREVAEERNLTVAVVAEAPVLVEGDAARLGQALANLVDNALKYTPAGGRVRLTARREAAQAVVEICDSGPGIPEEERAKVWRRLYRSDASRTQRGLGLGLSLVKAIVEAHRGTVTLDAAPEGGARFTVRLPV